MGIVLAEKLLILCSHEPTLDPRIEWAAEFSARAGYDVKVAGWTEGNPPPKFADTSDYETIRSDTTSAHYSRSEIRKLLKTHRIFSPFATPGIVLAAGVLFCFWAPYRLILAPWVILDYLLEKFRLSRFTTVPIERAGLRLRGTIFGMLDKVLGRRLSYLIEAGIGYNWYFRTHSMGAAGALLKRLETDEWIPDVIHANDPDAMLGTVLFKKIHGSRIIYDAHEYGPDAYLVRPKPRSIFFAFERQMLRHFDGALTVTPQLADKFQARYKGKPFFHVIPNASPFPTTEKEYRDPVIAEHGQGKVKFLYHGGFAPHRGIEQIMNGFRNIDPENAVLFVRGPENDFKPTLIAHAEEIGVLNRTVFFLESIAEADLIDSARLVDVGVIPYLSHIENHAGACPNKLSQYMHAELSILAVNLEFVANVIEASKGGLTWNDRVNGDFEKKVRTMIEDSSLRETFSGNAKAYGLNSFNYEQYYPILDALYKGCNPPQGISHTTSKT